METFTSRRNSGPGSEGHRSEGPRLRWVSGRFLQREHEVRGHDWDEDWVHPIECGLPSITLRFHQRQGKETYVPGKSRSII